MHFDGKGLDVIEADIRREAATLEAAVPALRAGSEDIVSEIPASPPRAYLIGCGDSLDGGIAARYVWDRMVSFPVEAVPAMTFTTSMLDTAPDGALVIALSQSGKVSRVIEGARAARARGLATVTITTNPSSPLAREPADASWVIDFDKLGAVPGTTSYLVGIVALYELGCALAGESSIRDALRADLDGLGRIVGEAIAACESVALEQAQAMARHLPVILLGYGPVLSSARFTVRKLLELAQLVVFSKETEEYAHDEYSLIDDSFRVMQFCPPGRGRTRDLEIAEYLGRLRVHLTVVSDGTDAELFGDPADILYALPPCPPSLVPLVYSIPGQLVCLATARRVGGSLYGMAERIHREDGDPQIYESEIAS
jgi:glucosamine--fructose-6-phosphate aminotransferase (isomerizing)